MLEINDTIISFDLLERRFVCDLKHCKGVCCIEGDAGAPLEPGEVELLEQALPAVWDDIPKASQAIISKQGVAYEDIDGDMVTSIVNGRECVFAYFEEDGTCKCTLEKAYYEGKTTFYKPISCHLYPVRISKYKHFTAVNYHQWDICKCAQALGQKEEIPVYKFLKTALIRRFGQAWYDELEKAAITYESAFKSIPAKYK